VAVSRQLWQTQRILLAIPVYNEERFLAQVLREVLHWTPIRHLLIVDDGSTDRTRDIIDRFYLPVLVHQANQGKGASILDAIRRGQNEGFRWLITMDGDGQHEANHLPLFLQAIEEGRWDVILGNRQGRSAAMPGIRRLSNGITSVMLSLLSGAGRLHDSQCGFRAFRIDRLQADLYKERGFQFESEMILRLGRQGARFHEVAVSTRYGDERSKIRAWHDTTRFIALVIRSIGW